MRRKVIDELDNDLEGKSTADLCRATNLLSALHLLREAWHNVTATTIQNCFKKGGFHINNSDLIPEDNDVVLPEGMTAEAFEE